MNEQALHDPLDELEIEPERYEFFEQPRYHFELDRRAFCRVLGGGIVVCLAAGSVQALQQPPGEGRRRQGGANQASQALGAWLHIGADGTITAYTGKVEIGQNARTSLAQAVAEELRVRADSIRMVMADTDLTPFDAGTFGSGSTPRMAPQLRRVGATARELLLDLAAESLGVERGTLVVADGKVSHAPTGRSIDFGTLAANKEMTRSVPADAPVTPIAQCKVVGTSVPKVEGRAMVTGKHQYCSDVKLPGMLFGKVLRPASFEAKLENVDTTAAEMMPGVAVVRDGEFLGVAAPTAERAEQALKALGAQWTEVPQTSADTLFDDLKTSSNGQGGGRGNQNQGSIEAGLAAAEHRLSSTYTIAYIAHAPLEPRAAVATWENGKLTVWTGTQRPFGVRGDLARAFNIGQENVRVIVPDMGSGYGGKHSAEAAVEAARLSKAAGKPVKLVWTREEEFTWAYFRPAGVIDVTAGVDKSGLLTAWDFHNYNSGGSAIRSLYNVANQRSVFHSVKSPLRQGSYRALAATANHFARECHMDVLAQAAATEPLKFRLQNLKDERLRGVLEAAAEQFGWANARPAKDRGFGIAGGSEKGSYVATCAEIAIDPASGKLKVVRLVTAFECGAVVNPDDLKNQIEGGVVMGLGGALFEAIAFRDGKITNPKFSRYRVPRFSDVPAMETVLVDRKDLPSVGAGETPIVAVAPAIANAIFQATGKRITSLPFTAQGIKV